MVVGIGGAGKTSIIRSLTESKDADPDASTAVNDLYSLAYEVTRKQEDGTFSRRLTRIFFSDHVGQDFATIKTTDFYANEGLKTLRKCLIFVVDLFEPPGPLEKQPGRRSSTTRA